MSAPTQPFPDRSEIEASQLAQLRRLLAEILPANRFYARKLAGVDVEAAAANLNSFRRLVPFTTKTELERDQAEQPPFGTNLTYPLERYTRYNQTSGTTRAPLRWVDTPQSWDWMLGQWRRVLAECDVGAGDRILFAFSFGPFLGFWTAYEAAAGLGCLCLPGGGLSSAARLQMMRDNRVNVLCCTPTYALRLAEAAGEAGVDLHKLALKAIIVGGEAGAGIPATRAAIESAWRPARLCDHHGMTEVGPASYECPRRPGVLHIIESAFIAEVIDPRSGLPVAPGETGELVLTPLGRTGMPLLRYRTGDVVRASDPSPGPSATARPLPRGERGAAAEACVCGRYDLALEGGILGRTDDMVVVRGVNVYPTAVEQIVRGCPGVGEYRVDVMRDRGMVELSMVIEPAPAPGVSPGVLPRGNGGTVVSLATGLAPGAPGISVAPGISDPVALAREVAKALRQALNLRVAVTPIPPGTLPRPEMKSRRWRML